MLKLQNNLECEAKVDNEFVWQGVGIYPSTVVGELEAGDCAREEDGEKVPVVVRR